MSLIFRATCEPSKNMFLIFERIDTNQFFDWSTGVWGTTSGSIYKSLSQDPAIPGRYATTAPHQQLTQFPIGLSVCLWLLRSTGDSTPAKVITWMESFIIDKLPFNYTEPLTAVFIDEPAVAF